MASLVAAAASPSLGASVRLYSAKATYRCLTHRPDFRSTSWYLKHQHAVLPRSAFDLIGGPPRPRAYDRYYIYKVGPVHEILFSFYANDIQDADLLFFDRVTKPALLEHLLLSHYPPRALPRPQFTLMRNVFIDTTPTQLAKAGATRAVILACLRTA